MRKEYERKECERIMSAFKRKYDKEGQVCILWSSEDSELARYFNYQRSLGSADQDPEGKIWVKIHDADPNEQMLKATVLEELGHALQFKQQGNVSATCDDLDKERKERELEIAKCLIDKFNRGRLKLSKDDVTHYQREIEDYE